MSQGPMVDLLNTFKPYASKDIIVLREALKWAILMSTTDEQIKPIGEEAISEIKAEIANRLYRTWSGPKFSKGDRVRVKEHIAWWPKATACLPFIGLQGVVIKASVAERDRYQSRGTNSDYEGLVVVQFRSDILGYGWQPGDDEDKEFTIYNMPNYTLELTS